MKHWTIGGSAETSLPFGLAFVAGVMLYVMFDATVSQSHGRGYHRLATFGARRGFVVMMTLDNLFP